MKKGLLWLLVIALFTILIYYDFPSSILCKKYYYKSPYNDKIVTRLEYTAFFLKQTTYFIPGKYEKITPPDCYVKPIYSGRDGGFVLLMHWTKSGCVFYFPHGLYESNECEGQIRLKELSQGSKEWADMKVDTVNGKNKLLTEYIF